MSCRFMLYNICHVIYITCVMLRYRTCVMLCYITYVMLCYITILNIVKGNGIYSYRGLRYINVNYYYYYYNICHVILCFITYVM